MKPRPDLHCPTCICTCYDGPGHIDKAAPFYGLVVEIDRIIKTAEAKARRRRRDVTETQSWTGDVT